MRVFGLPKAVYRIARHPPAELSTKAQERLRWLSGWEALREQGISAQQAAERLMLSRATLFRWQCRLGQGGPHSLEDGSRRPKRRRQPTWSVELAQAVLHLREERPRWGKEKLTQLLHQQGWEVSTSMVGRIITRLKARGVLREPLLSRVSVHQRQHTRPYAVRKPKEYKSHHPGDLVEVDTMEVRPLPGVLLKHFTARDVVSRWDVIEAHSRATATTAAGFLGSLQDRMPFPVRAIQVDGGSEFHADFERACQEKGIKLFVLPPHSPKLNGHVERAHRTHQEEFYELYDGDLDFISLNQALRDWEHVYNYIRPHQALDWSTPAEYLKQCHSDLALTLLESHM